MPESNQIAFDATVLEQQLKVLKETLNEKDYRHVLGALSNSIGRGGQSQIRAITNATHDTIRRGRQEMDALGSGELDPVKDGKRIREKGAGRPAQWKKYPELLEAVERIVQDSTYGSPEDPLRWTTMSLEKISELLKAEKIPAGKDTVAKVLDLLGYSRQQNQKYEQVGAGHPDRDAQFRFINETVQDYLNCGDPVISVDAKKKELIGNFKNGGSEYRLKGDPRHVLDHDFEIKELGHVAPYGIYVLNENTAFINLGCSRDTAEFAVNSLYLWWEYCGKTKFPNAKRILITCDGGGSNGSRLRLWKAEVAVFAALTGVEVQIAHFPPGTSKYNKIEHRVFCYISRSWAAKPLVDIETVTSLIGSTTTKGGLTVECHRDDNVYPTGVKVTQEEFDDIDIERVGPKETWNYIIRGFKTIRDRSLGAASRRPQEIVEGN